jgi:hypothetical protein
MFRGGKPSRHGLGPNIFKKTDIKHFTEKLSHALFVCKKKTANFTIPYDRPSLGTSYAMARMAFHHGTEVMRNKISMLLCQSFFLQRFKLIYLFFKLYLFFCSSNIDSLVSEIPPINKPFCISKYL